MTQLAGGGVFTIVKV